MPRVVPSWSSSVVVAALCVLSLIACTGCNKSSGGTVRLTAGGATFVDPIMQKWKDVYKKEKGHEIDYTKSGSGQGIKGVTKRELDFGCSDAPMNKKEIEEAARIGGEVVHIPVIIGSVAIIYNLPELTEPLVLSGSILADIFRGEIKNWDDPRIKALNPNQKLPSHAINPVVRGEESGTTFIFTEFLTKSSEAWATTNGLKTAKKPDWPAVCTQQPGNPGVARQVKENPFTIGYVELNYAKINQIPYAKIRNRANNSVAPEPAAVTAAAAAALKTKPTEEPYSLHELTYSLTDVDDPAAYPICGMSYVLLYKKQKGEKGKALVEFLRWATTKGQEYAESLDYAPLPKEMTEKIEARLKQISIE